MCVERRRERVCECVRVSVERINYIENVWRDSDCEDIYRERVCVCV